jgi:hypothetical protein
MTGAWRAVWLTLRVLAMVFCTIGVIFIPEARSNIGWGACFIISFISAFSMFLWLTVSRSIKRIDWSDPYSWDKPFWPMRKYPLRYLFVCSYSLTLAGAVAMLRDVIVRNGYEAVSGTVFFLGLFLGLALIVWIRRFKSNQSMIE